MTGAIEIACEQNETVDYIYSCILVKPELNRECVVIVGWHSFSARYVNSFTGEILFNSTVLVITGFFINVLLVLSTNGRG